MHIATGFEIVCQVFKNSNSVIYRAVRTENNKPVILKVLTDDYPSQRQISKFKHEYGLLCSMDTTVVAKAYGLQKHGNGLVMILEDFQGELLRNSMADRRFTLDEFLRLAIQVAEVLDKIHSVNIVHKNINPSSFLWDQAAEQIKLIDLSLATTLPQEQPQLENPQTLEGELAYVSPEQTGRMNRPLDYRTDFYSLGIVFYEILNGRAPFESTDAMELVHSHIAKHPRPPAEINPDVPPVLADIVMKLLDKNAEDRYQSAFGLKTDLDRCLKQLQETGKTTRFELARQDFSSKFQIPHKLYGREQEVKALLQAFDRIGEGTTELMLVAGYSGVGKSSLVHEIHKPITEKRGYFISGKHEQYQRSIPYYALTQALSQFCRYLLTEPAEILQDWQTRILNAVGNNGQVIIDVVPDLELVIGEQAPLPQVGPQESQNRFNMIFQKFIRAISAEEHPLVFFVDDLQWADAALLNLLKTLLTDKDINHLLIVGAYRDNEVDSAHPLIMTIDELLKENAFANTLKLENLSGEAVNALIVDTLDEESAEVGPLTGLVYEKTQGNAFFLTRFLQSLHEEGLVIYDHAKHKWLWDVAQIQAKQITDNVVDLMSSKIRKFTAETQSILKLASCIGSHFDLQTLSIIYQRDPKDTLACLWITIQEGLILPLDDNYQLVTTQDAKGVDAHFKFQHDRIRQAAYSLTGDSDRPRLHLQIGRLLLANTREADLEDRLFDIVHQLNKAHDLVAGAEDRLSLAQLNLSAGKKAKDSTAYQAAVNYLASGVSLLGESAWNEHYAVAFELYVEQGECEFLSGNFEHSDRLLALALKNARSNFDKVGIYTIKIAQLSGQGQYHDAVAALTEGLNMFGLNMPTLDQEEALENATASEMALYQENMKGREIGDLDHLPLMQDEGMKACSQMLGTAFDSIVIGYPDLVPLYTTKAVNMSLQYGLSPYTPVGYGFFAIVLSGGFKDYARAYEFAALALRLTRGQQDNLAPKTRVYVYNLYGFFNILREHINTCAEYFRETYRIALESGDYAYSCYALIERTRYVLPLSIKEFVKATQETIVHCRKVNNQPHLLLGQMYEGFAKNLQGHVSNTSFDHDDFTEDEFIRTFEKPAPLLCAIYKRYKLQSLALFNYYEDGLPLVHERATWVAAFGAIDLNLRSDYFLYTGITVAALYPNAQDAEKQAYLEILDECIDENRLLADQCKINFEHAYLILRAEKARIEDHHQEAMLLYDEAVASAGEYGYQCNEALANELAAKFYLGRGTEEIAQTHMRKAHYAYQRWGATAKVKDLEKRYPHLLPALHADRALDTSSEKLDLTTIMKAAQTISSEIVLENLLVSLMRIVIENAGAHQGYLLLEKQGELVIEAEGSIDCVEVTVLQSIPLDRDLVPRSIINYVHRTGKSVVLGDAAMDDRFASDPYIRTTGPKSVLCMPLMKRKQLIGCLYLENNLSINAFTTDRIDVLEMLSSQVAISLENAMFFRELEQAEESLRESEQRLELALTGADLGLWDWNLRTGKAVWSEATLSMVGYRPEEIEPDLRSWKRNVHPDDWQRVSEVLNSHLEGNTTIFEVQFRNRTKSGEWKWISARGKVVERDENDKPVRMVGTVLDITDSKRLEDQLLHAQKMEALGTLAGGIAHDFNNLLQAILGYSDLLLIKKAPGDPDSKRLEVIQNAVRDGADLVSRILTFSRKAESRTRPIDLNEEIGKARQLLRRTVPRMIEIKLVPAETLHIIDADPAQIEQVLLNLAINAQHAMPDGGQLLIETNNVSLSDKYLRTHLGAKRGRYVLLTVSDTGVGMKPEVLERIFEPFFTTKASSQGTGLGLSMVHGIVSQHGGHVRCYSELGRGASFKIYFPVSAREIISEDVSLTRGMPAFGTETILLVDDDDRIREMGRQMIEMSGYEVLIARSGEEALEMYTSHGAEISLVILDLIMPGMGGKRCLEELSDDE